MRLPRRLPKVRGSLGVVMTPPPPMTLGSLFAGVGGLDLGLGAALGCETVWQVEQSAAARAVLARHWPGASRRVTDVQHDSEDQRDLFLGTTHIDSLAKVDIICGGFPCTDISAAGGGDGIEGQKSGLWRDYERVLRRLRPSYAIVENSPLLTSRGLDRVLGDLAALGYDAEWARIGARDVGAPHRRWRLFIVAWHPHTLLHRLQGIDRRGMPARATRRMGDDASGGRRTRPADNWLSEPSIRRVVDGFPCRVDGHEYSRESLVQLGNAVVPQVAYEVGLWLRRIVARESAQVDRVFRPRATIRKAGF